MFIKLPTNSRYGQISVYYYDITNSLWVWYQDYPYITTSQYVMSSSVGVPIKVNGGAVTYPAAYAYGGQIYYTFVYNSVTYYLWVGAQWVISKILGYGNVATMPYWYKSLASGMGGLYTRGGTAGFDMTVAVQTIVGRGNSSLLGVYTPISGSGLSTNKELGLKRYRDAATGQMFYDMLETYNGQYYYVCTDTTPTRYLWYDGSRYIISSAKGYAVATEGYWTASVSSTDPAQTYTRTYSGGSPPTPVSYTLTFDSYSTSLKTYSLYFGQVAVWL